MKRKPGSFLCLGLFAGLSACAPPTDNAKQPWESGNFAGNGEDGADGGEGMADTGATDTADPMADDPFGDSIVDFNPGSAAGFGQDQLPRIVLGPPQGAGEAGSLDVLSLGDSGEIILTFDDIGLTDGPGPDLIIFENPFPGWVETGVVAVSLDGETWSEWPCDPTPPDFVGCAGKSPVWSNPANGIDPTDPEVAGGDAFDLNELGVSEAYFVRIRDSGANTYEGIAGGFDLDAIAVVNGTDPA